MKTKKTVIAVLVAALVIALIIGCNISQDNEIIDLGGKLGEKQSATTADDLVTVRLNVNASNVPPRTIIPTTVPTQLSDFDYFTLQIIKDNGDNTTSSIDLSTGGYNTFFDNTKLGAFSISLASGFYYKFTLIGYEYDSGGLTYTAIAAGEKTQSISAAGAVNIVLKEITDGTGTGTFQWDVNIEFDDPLDPGNDVPYETANLTLTNLKGGSVFFNPPTNDISILDLLDDGALGDNHTGSIPVPSGYYKMVIELGKPGYQTVYVQEIVHIYAGGFVSEYDRPLPNLRSNLHKITFNYAADSSSSGLTPYENIAHGKAYNAASGGLQNTSPAHSNSSGFIFERWHTSAITGNTVTDNASILDYNTLVIKPVTLYAKWTATSNVNVNLSVSVGFTGSYDPDISKKGVGVGSFSQGSASFDITLVINNPASYDTFSWYKDTDKNTPIVTKVVGTDLDPYEAQIAYSLNAGGVDWWQTGKHTIILIVSDSHGALAENSGKFEITCTP